MTRTFRMPIGMAEVGATGGAFRHGRSVLEYDEFLIRAPAPVGNGTLDQWCGDGDEVITCLFKLQSRRVARRMLEHRRVDRSYGPLDCLVGGYLQTRGVVFQFRPLEESPVGPGYCLGRTPEEEQRSEDRNGKSFK